MAAKTGRLLEGIAGRRGRRGTGRGMAYIHALYRRRPGSFERLRRRLLCYSERKLRKLYGDDNEFDLAMSLKHGYILELPRRQQRLELARIKRKMDLLFDAGLTERAINYEWCCDILVGKSARFVALLPQGDASEDIPFEDLDDAGRAEWWDRELRKLAANARNAWMGLPPNDDFAAVATACKLWVASCAYEAIDRDMLRQKCAMIDYIDEKYLLDRMILNDWLVRDMDLKEFEAWLQEQRDRYGYLEGKGRDRYGRRFVRT